VGHSRVEVYIHYVWGTIHREPLVTPEFERLLYRCIQAQCDKLECPVIAIGGMPDHIHLAVRLNVKLPIWKVMHVVKGTSSAFMRDKLIKPGDMFGWQDGYGSFSFGGSDTGVVEYIRNQKRHHADGTLWPEVEKLPDDE